MKLKVTINSRSHVITEDRDLRKIVDALGNEFSRQVVFPESMLDTVIEMKKVGRLPLCNFYTKDENGYKLLMLNNVLEPVDVKLTTPLELELLPDIIGFDFNKDGDKKVISGAIVGDTLHIIDEQVIKAPKKGRKKKGE